MKLIRIGLTVSVFFSSCDEMAVFLMRYGVPF